MREDVKLMKINVAFFLVQIVVNDVEEYVVFKLNEVISFSFHFEVQGVAPSACVSSQDHSMDLTELVSVFSIKGKLRCVDIIDFNDSRYDANLFVFVESPL